VLDEEVEQAHFVLAEFGLELRDDQVGYEVGAAGFGGQGYVFLRPHCHCGVGRRVGARVRGMLRGRVKGEWEGEEEVVEE